MRAQSPDIVAFTREDIERSIPERFASIAEAHASELAVVAGERHVSYCELAARVDAIAREIARRCRDRRSPLVVLARDPVNRIAGMLATWQSGRVCVPIDAAQPPARVARMLRHCGAGLVLTDGLLAAVAEPGGTIPQELRIEKLVALHDGVRARMDISGTSEACIFYTSGSTGEPKGVLRTHRSLLHRARASIAFLGIRPGDRVGIVHALGSPGGVRDALATLLGGAALSTFDLKQEGFASLARWIDSERISVLCGVVSTWRHAFASIRPDVRFDSLRMVRLGSEPIYRSDVEQLRRHVRPDCTLVTGYGATETSGIAEYRMDGTSPLPNGRIPAGYPLEGVEIIIEDDARRAVETGASGEIVVRCAYLASGYWHDEALSRAVFDRDPADGRVCAFRTGDVGRLRADGCLEVLGRRDEQVKIRGHRVNPGEIELALVEHPSIREAAVTSRTSDDGDVRLIAYLVPQNGPVPSDHLLRRYLETRLPPYMLPSAFVTLESMPLTATGKADRRALPLPPATQLREEPFVAPRSPTEHQVAEIWERILGVSPIGAEDNFFDLGGDSLRAAALVSALEETFGRPVRPALLLQASTVADLAAAILAGDAEPIEPVTALRTAGARTPIFFLHNDAGRGLYTHALARCVDAQRPFYAVHRDIVDASLQLSIEAFAADRIAALRSVRPHGPYVLGGHCNGGLIALEMARQLERDGEEVELVLMVDTCVPNANLQTLRRAWNAADRLLGRALRDRFELGLRVGREVGWRTRYYVKRTGALASAGIDAQVDFARRKLSARKSEGPGDARSARRFYAPPPRPIDLHQAYRRAISRYVPHRYAGRVALFRAEAFPAARPDLGWSEYLPHLEIEVVPGDHHSCITRHVATFGARIDKVLRRTPSLDPDEPAAESPP